MIRVIKVWEQWCSGNTLASQLTGWVFEQMPRTFLPWSYCFLDPRWSASRGTEALSSHRRAGNSRSHVYTPSSWCPSGPLGEVEERMARSVLLALSFLGWHGVRGGAGHRLDWEPPRDLGPRWAWEGNQCIRTCCICHKKRDSPVFLFLPDF